MAKKSAAVIKKFPPHVGQLLDNLSEVGRLVQLHHVISGTGPGRRHGVEVLNKSALVLTVACWESFVEDLASAALDYSIENAGDHSAFPRSVLERVGGKYSGVNAWQLAGEGWKKALRDNYKEILAKTTGILNTPRAAQVDDLLLKTIGLKDISSCWYWGGRSNASAIDALDKLITVRGAIAHRVQHATGVRKHQVTSAATLISFLAAKSSNRVRSHVNALTGKHPWERVTYKGVG